MIAEKGVYLIDMYQAMNVNDSVTFVKLFLKVDSIEIAQKKVISRNFEGSIKAEPQISQRSSYSFY